MSKKISINFLLIFSIFMLKENFTIYGNENDSLKKSKYVDNYPSYQCKNKFGNFDNCLRASQDLTKGTIVASAEFTKTENEFIANDKSEEFRHVAIMGLKNNGEIQWGKVNGKMAIVNHSCEPNCEIIDDKIVTLKNVKKDEELTIAYDTPIKNVKWDSKWNFKCLCEAKKCRKFLDSYNEKRPERVLPVINNESSKQIPWTILNVRGYYIEPKTGKIDDTESFGAIDSIMQEFKTACPTNFDNGGGKFDDNTDYLKKKYNVENIVYDPFMRTSDHNKKILELIEKRKFDCSTSFSVLNVINTIEARLEHIKLCYNAIKENGYTFFKIWPGDNTGIPTIKNDYFQSNKNATHYIAEVKQVYGNENVFLIDDKTIKAIKKRFYN